MVENKIKDPKKEKWNQKKIKGEMMFDLMTFQSRPLVDSLAIVWWMIPEYGDFSMENAGLTSKSQCEQMN